MSEFVIDVATLRSPAERVEAAADAGEIGLPPEQWAGKIRGVFQVETLGEKLSVRGTLQGVAILECVRCLRRFEKLLRAPLDVFAERSGHGSRTEEEELERDHDLVFFNGRQLDLSEAAREALIVEIPMAPHCRDDCRGLCPKCGADLNEAPCECPAES